MKLKKILVPFDFSDLAQQALEYAAWLAKQTGATLILTHIIEDTQLKSIQQLAANNAPQARAYEEQLAEVLQEHLEKATKAYQVNQVEVLPHLETGKVVKTLLQQIETHTIDLVVMATHAQSGFFKHTHTEQLVAETAVPVLTIRTESPCEPIKKIVLAVDLSYTDLEVYQKIKDFQVYFDAELVLLFVIQPNKFYSTQEVHKHLEKLIVDVPFTNYRIDTVNAYNEEDGITYYAQQNQADWIVLTTHQRKGLSYFFKGSVTAEVIKQASLPTLVLGITYNS